MHKWLNCFGFSAACVLALTCTSCSKKADNPPQKLTEPPAADAIETNDTTPHLDDLNKPENVAAPELDKNDAPALDKKSPKKRSPVVRDFVPADMISSALYKNPLLAETPGASFMVLASSGAFDFEQDGVEDALAHVSELALSLSRHIKHEDKPFWMATKSLFQGIFKSFSPQKLKSLGVMSDDYPAHFVFYFSRQMPVLKFSVADSEKLRNIVESYWTQNKVKTRIPQNILTKWTLVRVSDDSPMELAVHWDEHRVIVTAVAGDENAQRILPELTMPTPRGKSALEQLDGIQTNNAAVAVGMVDFNVGLNNLMAYQTQYQMLTGREVTVLDKNCIKDMRRIATSIPKLTMALRAVRGGATMGLDADISIDVSQAPWFAALAESELQTIEFERDELMPVMEFHASVDGEHVLAAAKYWRDAIRREAFSCSFLTSLNNIDVPEKFAGVSAAADYAHHIGAVVYDGTIDVPKRYAAYWRSDEASAAAVGLGFMESKKVLEYIKEMEGEAAPEEAGEDAAPSEDGVEENVPKTAAENEENQPSKEPVVFDDARLKGAGVPAGIRLSAADDAIAAGSDDVLTGKVAAQKMVTSNEILHWEISERAVGGWDEDAARDARVGVDVMARPTGLFLKMRYVLE